MSNCLSNSLSRSVSMLTNHWLLHLVLTEAIRIFYFNLITPNRFSFNSRPCLCVLYYLSSFSIFSFSLCLSLRLQLDICHVAGLVFVINLNLPPHNHTSAGGPGISSTPAFFFILPPNIHTLFTFGTVEQSAKSTTNVPQMKLPICIRVSSAYLCDSCH